MPGGIMQLVSTGGLDQYIIGSPEISYFKAVYKRHTNFAMESVRQTFLTAPVLTTGVTTVTSRIGRIGDLLSDVYLNFRLPAIYSRNVTVGNEVKNYKFRWIKNIGEYVIRKYSLRMDTQLIDEGYGEWIEIWNELSLPPGKRAAYNEMIGNVPEVINPLANNVYAVIRNNNLTFESYNVSDGTTPSIEERRIIIPIPFWFAKNPALALPLVALQYQTVDVILELSSVEDLYQVFDENADIYVSPVEYGRRYPAESGNVSIQNFVQRSVSVLPNTLDIDAHLECNYIFLDDAERRLIATSTLDYLVERIYRSEQGGITTQGTMNLVLSNPVKEMIWFARRSDMSSYNDWTNFTRTYPEDKRYPIMASAKFMWNGMERMEEKSGDYFNKIQPFQHHSNGPRQGLYSYSFALHPEKWQPSGSFNASMISRIQMYVTTNAPPSSTEEYTFTVYSMYYNVFHVVAGTAGMVNAN